MIMLRRLDSKLQNATVQNIAEHRIDVTIDFYFLAALFLTSSSLHECNIILFGCPGVIPEWPLDQS